MGHGTSVPIVVKTDWEIIDISNDDEVTLMDEGGNQKADLNLPTIPPTLGQEIREAWNEGENTVSVSVQSSVGEEAIISYQKVKAHPLRCYIPYSPFFHSLRSK